MNKKGSGSTDALCAPIHGLLPDLETLYTDIHAHPELSLLRPSSGLRRPHLLWASL